MSDPHEGVDQLAGSTCRHRRFVGDRSWRETLQSSISRICLPWASQWMMVSKGFTDCYRVSGTSTRSQGLCISPESTDDFPTSLPFNYQKIMF